MINITYRLQKKILRQEKICTQAHKERIFEINMLQKQRSHEINMLKKRLAKENTELHRIKQIYLKDIARTRKLQKGLERLFHQVAV